MGPSTFAINGALFICSVNEGSLTVTEGLELPKLSSMFKNSIELHAVRSMSEPLSSAEQQS